MNLPTAQLISSKPAVLHHHTISSSHNIIASAGPESSSLHSLCPLSKLRAPLAFKGPLRIVHPLGKSNFLFLVEAQGHKVLLWDDVSEEVVLELAFKNRVLAVRSRHDKLVVVLRHRIVLFSLALNTNDRADVVIREGEYTTVDNPLGLAAIATAPRSTLLAFPGRQAGQVQLIRLPPLGVATSLTLLNPTSSLPPYQTIHIFLAHTSPLRTLTLSETGSLLCTSSTKGTLLRVFSTSTRQLVRELRRGTDEADIWSVAFCDQHTGQKVACCSDKGTIHVWRVGDLLSLISPSSFTSQTKHRRGGSDGGKEKTLAIMKPYLPAYFSSQWSDLTWRIPDTTGAGGGASREASTRENDDIATCVFAPIKEEQIGEDNDQLLVITRSGAWYRLSTTASPASEAMNSSLDFASFSSAKVGKGKSREEEKHCIIMEYRRIGLGDVDDEEEDWTGSD